MKTQKGRLGLILLVLVFLVPPKQSYSQIAILDIIKAGVKKVIRAVDLKIQRQQNKIIWLQNAQKTIENTMSKFKLDEISDWTNRQKEIYKKYFDELQRVKAIISYYQRIKSITEKQKRIVESYQRSWQLVKNDKHFSAKEIEYMGKVYMGIINETVKNIDQLLLVVNSFKVQMTDAKRMEIINSVADKVDRNYSDLQIFNQQNAGLSIQRANSASEIDRVKQMYGFN